MAPTIECQFDSLVGGKVALDGRAEFIVELNHATIVADPLPEGAIGVRPPEIRGQPALLGHSRHEFRPTGAT